MMKVAATAFLIGCLLVAPALAQAQTTALGGVPEDVLMQGVSNLTVCIRGNRFAMSRLSSIIKSMQAEEPRDMAEDNQKIVSSAITDINDIGMIVMLEKIMAKHLIDEGLIQVYHHTLPDIVEKLKDVVSATDKGLEEAFKDVNEYKTFTEQFSSKENTCATMIEQLGEKLQKYQKNSQEAQP